jgi:hypothetical protein
VTGRWRLLLRLRRLLLLFLIRWRSGRLFVGLRLGCWPAGRWLRGQSLNIGVNCGLNGARGILEAGVDIDWDDVVIFLVGEIIFIDVLYDQFHQQTTVLRIVSRLHVFAHDADSVAGIAGIVLILGIQRIHQALQETHKSSVASSIAAVRVPGSSVVGRTRL